MYSAKYRLFLNVWNYVPFKKYVLDFVKKTPIGKTRKYIGDLYINDVFTARIDDVDFKLYSEKGDRSTYDTYLFGLENGWDKFSLKIWMKLAESSNVIVDVGTNIGLYCLAAKAKNKAATVIGFEPSNRAFNVVHKNTQINNFDIRLEKKALSSKSGVTTFYDLNQHTAVSSLELNDNLKDLNYVTYDVDVMTFDDYKKRHSLNKIDLISIDVEEHEPEVLKGMKDILEHDKPTIFIEVLHEKIGFEIQYILKKYNYRFYWIDEEGRLVKADNLGVKPIEQIAGYNVFAVSDPIIEDSILKLYGVEEI